MPLMRAARAWLCLAAVLLWAASAWASSTDSGLITKMYSNNGGYLAVFLNNGYPNAVNECPGANGWAGVNGDPANKDIKATLMLAKAMGQQVEIVVDGCEAGGAWYKIAHVYVL